jgi:hypothetical protein
MTTRWPPAAVLYLIATSATAALGAARVGAETDAAEPVYVCVRLDAGAGPQLRVVTAHQACRPREERMLRVFASRGPFFANPAPRAGVDRIGSQPFVAQLLASAARLAQAAPLLVEATIVVEADRPGRTLSGQAVSCAALLDGQPTGAPAALAAAPTPPSHVGFVDAATGEIITPPPVDVPDVFWSSLTRTGSVAAGPHEIAIVCGSQAPFRFLGVAGLTVLQQLPAVSAR